MTGHGVSRAWLETLQIARRKLSGRHYDLALTANNGFIEGGDWSEPGNYRPDTLTSIICKMTESINK